jgi:hypothetical protein
MNKAKAVLLITLFVALSIAFIIAASQASLSRITIINTGTIAHCPR